MTCLVIWDDEVELLFEFEDQIQPVEGIEPQLFERGPLRDVLRRDLLELGENADHLLADRFAAHVYATLF